MRSRDADLNATRRRTIVEAAARCFVARGFHATGMKDICIAADMSPGTLYHYVRSKTDIIAAIVAEEREWTAELIAGLGHGPDRASALGDALEQIVRHVTDDDLMLHAEIAAEVLRQPALREQAKAAQRQAIAALALAVMPAGETVPGEATLVRAAAIMALIDGWLAQAALSGVDELRRRLPAMTALLRGLVDDGTS
jgi:AcrR family transcriptional regulator